MCSSTSTPPSVSSRRRRSAPCSGRMGYCGRARARWGIGVRSCGAESTLVAACTLSKRMGFLKCVFCRFSFTPAFPSLSLSIRVWSDRVMACGRSERLWGVGRSSAIMLSRVVHRTVSRSPLSVAIRCRCAFHPITFNNRFNFADVLFGLVDRTLSALLRGRAYKNSQYPRSYCAFIHQPGTPIRKSSCEEAYYFHIVAVIAAKTRKYPPKLQLAARRHAIRTRRHSLFHIVECSRLTPRDFPLFSCSLRSARRRV